MSLRARLRGGAPARPAAEQPAPAAPSGCAGGEAGRGAPRWLPAPHGWPGSGECSCSTGQQNVDRASETSLFIQ